MINFYAIFSEFKRLLASRQDRTTTSPLEPTSSSLRDPNPYQNSIPLPTSPPLYTPMFAPHSLYSAPQIGPIYELRRSSSVVGYSHQAPISLTPAFSATGRSTPPPSWQSQGYNPSGSETSISINIPPPAYIGRDQPPTYSYSENSVGPAWHMAGVQNPGFAGLGSQSNPRPPQRSRISPVVGPARSRPVLSDPSQNPHPGSYVPGRATPRHVMHRGTLFSRIISTRRNMWLPAIVVGAVIGVYVLVKVGGKDEDMKK